MWQSACWTCTWMCLFMTMYIVVRSSYLFTSCNLHSLEKKLKEKCSHPQIFLSFLEIKFWFHLIWNPRIRVRLHEEAKQGSLLPKKYRLVSYAFLTKIFLAICIRRAVGLWSHMAPVEDRLLSVGIWKLIPIWIWHTSYFISLS